MGNAERKTEAQWTEDLRRKKEIHAQILQTPQTWETELRMKYEEYVRQRKAQGEVRNG